MLVDVVLGAELPGDSRGLLGDLIGNDDDGRKLAGMAELLQPAEPALAGIAEVRIQEHEIVGGPVEICIRLALGDRVVPVHLGIAPRPPSAIADEILYVLGVVYYE